MLTIPISPTQFILRKKRCNLKIEEARRSRDIEKMAKALGDLTMLSWAYYGRPKNSEPPLA